MSGEKTRPEIKPESRHSITEEQQRLLLGLRIMQADSAWSEYLGLKGTDKISKGIPLLKEVLKTYQTIVDQPIMKHLNLVYQSRVQWLLLEIQRLHSAFTPLSALIEPFSPRGQKPSKKTSLKKSADQTNIDELFKALEDREPSSKKDLSCLIQYLKKEENAQFILHQHYLPTLLKWATLDNIDIRREAVVIISHLIIQLNGSIPKKFRRIPTSPSAGAGSEPSLDSEWETESETELNSTSVIETIMRIFMSTIPDVSEPALLSEMITAFCILTTDPRNTDLFWDNSVPQFLLDQLRGTATQPRKLTWRDKQNILIAFGNLALKDARSQEQLKKIDVVDELIKQLQRCVPGASSSETSDFSSHCLWVLSMCAANHPENQTYIGRNLSSLLPRIITSTRENDILFYALQLLGNLLCHHRSNQDILRPQSWFIERMIRLIHDSSTDKTNAGDIPGLMAFILANIACDQKKYQDAIIAAGGIPLLKSYLTGLKPDDPKNRNDIKTTEDAIKLLEKCNTTSSTPDPTSLKRHKPEPSSNTNVLLFNAASKILTQPAASTGSDSDSDSELESTKTPC